ncbi:amphiphysin isoform X1 [Peromyscus maniculatus bairdii]|uniref:amphiphysin isoform X1 n=1 Tax=Peromyscus maniculatus bairdii TaxID=230844 RepID=UPI00042AEA03|nr:amphiphysin isoform X1 [Peromyscus maniculatus bairdii]
MADIKTGIFAKNVQKRLNRAQEKVLQKLGKADETKDEQFEEYVQNFKRQEAEGTRLQRELRGYLAAIKGMQEASMKLTESLHEVYEPDWYGREDVKMVGEKCDVLWEDFHQKLVDGSLLTLDTYLGQFPDIKNRIAKRSRKLVDYDSARHHLEALQSSKRKDESRISKAEEEFQKAQKVFEEFNVDLQEELPSLWSRRIGFYVNTFKNVSSLEAKFHKEIAVLCHKLYEVMTKLGDQHADKAFSIQGAPSDSGPLRIAKTPSPPEEPSPLPSPTASPNHTLAPASPAPVRPRSPSQTRKGPPVPPLPKVTPTKELQQENIINFFEDNFVPEINVTTPSQNEVLEVKKEETLLDLDFDPFKPDVAPAGSATATHSPMSQTLPWDLWTTSTDLVQPASGGSFNGFTQPQDTSLFTMQADQNMVGGLAETEQALSMEPQAEEPPAATAAPAAGLDLGLEMEEPKEEAVIPPGADADETVGTTVPTEGVSAEEAEAEKAALPAAEGESLEGAKIDAESAEVASSESPPPAETEGAAPQEKVIPSVVIEPASNHEGEGEHHEITVGAETREATEAGNTPQEQAAEATPLDSQAAPSGAVDSSVSAEDAAQEVPPGFLYKVETLHDFEAANSDELNLQRGDVVLVVPSDSEADQDAGWLVGVKESDWLQYRDLATYKGLFPENFTRRLE